MFKVKSRTLGEANMPFSALKYPVVASIKYDGRNTEVHVMGKSIIYETSGGKQFQLMDNYPFDQLPDGHYFAEMMGHGVEGKLGDRIHSGIQTTFFTRTAKGLKNDNPRMSWRIFAYLNDTDYRKGKTGECYSSMISRISGWDVQISSDGFCPRFKLIGCEKDLRAYYKMVRGEGYEGLMVVDATYCWANSTSRLKTSVKMKDRPTMKATCVGMVEGTGKYMGMIGSLVLDIGVTVGSGLTDKEREFGTPYIGKIIEISYEQLSKDGLPLQPTFEAIRESL